MNSKPEIFVFNPFQVNSFIVADEGGECILIDPACSPGKETEHLLSAISLRGLKPLMVLNTHAHVDHLLGVDALCREFRIPFLLHSDDTFLLDHAVSHAEFFGLDLIKAPRPDLLLKDGDVLEFGGSNLSIIHVPGHSPGSVVMKSEQGRWIISGDVLFAGSIGRSDLPGGNHDLLVSGIKQKLLSLEDGFLVYPGHGPSTTIGKERIHNPFLT